MSIRVMSWVFRNSQERLGNRLVLLAIADYASDDGGNCWASVETLAKKAMLSERQTRNCLRSLEQSGAISETSTSKRGTHVYQIVMDDVPEISAPPEIHDTVGGQNPTAEVSRIAPDPSLEQPSIEPSTTPPIVPPSGSTEIVKADGFAFGAPPPSWRVDRKLVSDNHGRQAQAILREWNEQTGAQLRSTDWLAKIVMRLREYPELTVDDHAAIIAANLADPWWKGAANPSVVYGNGAQFERAMATARAPKTSGSEGAFRIVLDTIRQMKEER